ARGDVELGLPEFRDRLGDGTRPVRAADEKRLLRTDELPLGGLRRRAEGRGVLGYEVNLRAPPAGKAGERQQIHARVAQRCEHGGADTGGIRRLDVEVLDDSDGIGHGGALLAVRDLTTSCGRAKRGQAERGAAAGGTISRRSTTSMPGRSRCASRLAISSATSRTLAEGTRPVSSTLGRRSSGMVATGRIAAPASRGSRASTAARST